MRHLGADSGLSHTGVVEEALLPNCHLHSESKGLDGVITTIVSSNPRGSSAKKDTIPGKVSALSSAPFQKKPDFYSPSFFLQLQL